MAPEPQIAANRDESPAKTPEIHNQPNLPLCFQQNRPKTEPNKTQFEPV
jgi:hypothetical protein